MNNSSGQQNSRLFTPQPYLLGPSRSLEQPSDIIHHILRYDTSSGLTRLAINNLGARRKADRTLHIDESSLVVGIDGIHDRTTTSTHSAPDPRVQISRSSCTSSSSYGLYFGRNSSHNTSAIIPPGLRQTKEVAILSAAYIALDLIQSHFLSDGLLEDSSGRIIPGSTSLKRVILMTDSDYLVRFMSDYVWILEDNDYKNSRGEEVAHARELRDMADMICAMEELGIEIRMWLVGKGGVLEANRLAREALSSNAASMGDKEIDAIRSDMSEVTNMLNREWEAKARLVG